MDDINEIRATALKGALAAAVAVAHAAVGFEVIEDRNIHKAVLAIEMHNQNIQKSTQAATGGTSSGRSVETLIKLKNKTLKK